MAATPNSSNTLFGRGAVMFDRFDSNGVAQGQYIHLGNCSDFAISITTDVAELTDFTQSTSAVYNSAVKKTNVNVKISGFEVSTKNMGILLLGSITTYTQAAGTVSGATLVPASLTGVKGSFFRGTKRNLTSATLTQSAATLVSGTDWEIFDASAGVFRILSGGAAADTAAITATYVHTALTAGSTALDVVQAGVSADIKGKLLFLPSNSTGPKIEVQAYNVSLQPDGDVGLISEDWLKWNMKGTVNSDSAGTYGGSTTEPYFRTVTR
jgi:hypothetical protein